MAQPEPAMVPRFCRHPVGWANLLLYVVGRPIQAAREKCRGSRNTASGLDGAQWRLLHGSETGLAGSLARASALVSLGSIDDVVERDGAAFPHLLFQRGTHRHRRSEYFAGSRNIHRTRGLGWRLVLLRSGGAVASGQI